MGIMFQLFVARACHSDLFPPCCSNESKTDYETNDFVASRCEIPLHSHGFNELTTEAFAKMRSESTLSERL